MQPKLTAPKITEHYRSGYGQCAPLFAARVSVMASRRTFGAFCRGGNRGARTCPDAFASSKIAATPTAMNRAADGEAGALRRQNLRCRGHQRAQETTDVDADVEDREAQNPGVLRLPDTDRRRWR